MADNNELKIQAYVEMPSAKTVNQQIGQLEKQIDKLTVTGQFDEKPGLSWIKKLGAAWEKLMGKKFTKSLQGALVSQVKAALSEIKNLDSLLTEIGKTSNLTKKQLADLGDTAYSAASKYGRSAADYLTEVQNMYLAGFNNAEEMAELSLLAQSAGGLSSDTAEGYLTAAAAAYELKGNAEKLNEILNSQHYIAGNASITMQEMAQATTKAAGSAAKYGIGIRELSSLIAVAAANTAASGSDIGSALAGVFASLADSSNGLKTPVESLKELSEAYSKLPEGSAARTSLLDSIADEDSADILAAILGSWDSYEEMLDKYSQGISIGFDSARKAAESSADNITGSLNRLSNTWTDTVDNMANSDVIVTLVNGFNGLLSVLNSITDIFGSWGSVGLGAGLLAGIQNVGRDQMHSLKTCFLF